MKLEQVKALITEHDIQSIDIKYSDLSGNWYHLGFPVAQLEHVLENGVPFDGSSIPGMRNTCFSYAEENTELVRSRGDKLRLRAQEMPAREVVLQEDAKP